MRKTVFLDYTQEELDRAYDQRVWARNVEDLLAVWRDAVAPARAGVPHYAERAYGDSPSERLDVYAGTGTGCPVHIHVHGGAWRSQSKDDGALLARSMVASGMQFVVPDFDLLPAVRMPRMVDQLARAVAFVHAHAEGFGGDPDKIILSGHSSGAHLAAVLATLDWSAYGLPADVVKALVCISGAYDLEAVLVSARRTYIELDSEEADRLSAPRHAARIPCPTWVLWGEHESPDFIRQGESFAAALEAAGRLAGARLVPGLNHFEMCAAIADAHSPVHAAILDALARTTARESAQRPARAHGT
ncbi:arylformamidase [Amorphus suaedae]